MKKRWLGWLTALLCFVGATASAACTHENAVRVSASSYNASYENTGDVRFHKVRKRTRTELFCPGLPENMGFSGRRTNRSVRTA